MKILEIETEPFHRMDYMSSGPGGIPNKRELNCFRAFVDELPDGIASIVATSDLQGRAYRNDEFGELIGVQLAAELKTLEELNEISPVSLVLLSGDLYDYSDCRKLGGTGPVTDVWNAFAERFPLVVGVHGNHDIVDGQAMAENTAILDGNSTNAFGLRVAGVSGIIGRPGKNQRKSPEDFLKKLEQALKSGPRILLLHAGPDDPATGRIGDGRIREVLEKRGNSVVFFGHCHWKEFQAQFGRNQAVNVDGRVLILSRRG